MLEYGYHWRLDIGIMGIFIVETEEHIIRGYYFAIDERFLFPINLLDNKMIPEQTIEQREWPLWLELVDFINRIF